MGHINAAFVVVENGSQMASKGRVRIGGGQLTQLQTHRDLAKTRRYMIGWIYWRDLGTASWRGGGVIHENMTSIE